MGRFIDLTGNIFGRLQVLERVENDIQGKVKWLCKCECGNQTIATRNDLRTGDKNSCGCLRKDLLRIDIINKRFGKLVVISIAEKNGKSTAQFWNCICDCGTKCIKSSQNLRKGQISSCGCLKESEIEINKFSEEFYNKVDKTKSCWQWKGLISRGYGVFFVGKMIKAHRYSYLLHKGLIPETKIVCHICDNPACVNPDHLYAGTYSENAKDRENRTNKNKRKLLEER